MNSQAEYEYISDLIATLHVKREELETIIEHLGIEILCTSAPPSENKLAEAVSVHDAARLRAYATEKPIDRG